MAYPEPIITRFEKNPGRSADLKILRLYGGKINSGYRGGMADTAKRQALAHVRQDADGQWHEHFIDAHAQGVSRLAAAFAQPFGGSEWARLAGLWHDLEKYRPAFQHYVTMDLHRKRGELPSPLSDAAFIHHRAAIAQV